MLCCGACGGEPDEAVDVSAAWLLFYVAAHIFDNVEDSDDPEAWYAQYSPGVALNTGCGLFFTASMALHNLNNKSLSSTAAGEIQRTFQEQMLIMSSGQHDDLTLQQINLDQYWKIAEGKSGAFFDLACWSGARLACDNPDKLRYFKEFGQRLGLLLQLLDDLSDINPAPGSRFIASPAELYHSFVMAYAMSVFPEAQRKQLQDNLELSSQDEQAARQVYNILGYSGIDLYLLTEIERQRSLALKALENAAPISPYRELLLRMIPDLHTKRA